jgi:hypothetical protein
MPYQFDVFIPYSDWRAGKFQELEGRRPCRVT